MSRWIGIIDILLLSHGGYEDSSFVYFQVILIKILFNNTHTHTHDVNEVMKWK